MTTDTEHWRIGKTAVADGGGIVAAQHHLAARAGAAMLDRGGNAVDAAIATALALGAVEPWMCGLGGSGLMVIWIAEENRAMVVDFQGVLAAAATPEDYPVDPDLPATLMGFPAVRGRANTEGYRSITVPGAAAGFDHALERFGTLDRAAVATPAIALAETGLAVDWFSHLQISLAGEVLARDPVSAAHFLPGGRPAPPETRRANPALADTLAAFAEGGAERFYRGDLARIIAADLAAGGSAIGPADLAGYQVLETEVLETRHRGARIYTPGATSGGQRLADCLGHVARALPDPPPAPTPQSWAVYAGGLAAAWAAHNRRIGRATEIGGCTSHLSVIDAAGNMVALTHTLLNRFGSGVTLPGTGLVMNNAVSYFDPRPGFPTSIAPGLRINASNMCPAVAVAPDRCFALGASGGNHIVPAVTQVAALMLDFGWDVERAVNHPRIDMDGGGRITADPLLGDDIIDALAGTHPVEIAQRLVFPKLYGCVSAVSRDAAGMCRGITDPSHPAAAAAGPAPFPEITPAPEAPDVRA